MDKVAPRILLKNNLPELHWYNSPLFTCRINIDGWDMVWTQILKRDDSKKIFPSKVFSYFFSYRRNLMCTDSALNNKIRLYVA